MSASVGSASQEMEPAPPTRDPARPTFHFTVPQGWINDPLGLTFRHGKYHVFAQHVPAAVEWNSHCYWAHATSTDLMDWTHHPVALEPGDGDGGVWSGCIVEVPGEPAHLFYTSVQDGDTEIGRPRVARPKDEEWITWDKGPVVAELPSGIPATAYRDPFVFHDGHQWRMLVGGGLSDGTAVAWVHTSQDLEHWRFTGELTSRHTSQADPVWTGTVWECTAMFPLGDRWVLVVSVLEAQRPHYLAYAVGEYAAGRFTPSSWARLTYGPSYYAPSTFVDEGDRRGLIHWLRDIRDPAGRWAGALSVPHLLSLHQDRLVAAPHPNVTARRGAPQHVPPATRLDITPTSDIEWTLETPDAPASWAPATLAIRDDAGSAILTLRADRATLTANTANGSWTMPLLGPARVLVDGPVCEIFTEASILAVAIAHTSAMTIETAGPARATVFALSPRSRPPAH